MRRIHLLAVDGPPRGFSPLIAAARRAGLRLGWLELVPPEPLEPVPPALAAAAALGVAKAVAVGGGRSVAVKTLAGAPVVVDLLREHFLGCAAVLVHGGIDAPGGPVGKPQARLAAAGDGWRVTVGAGERTVSTAELIARLRRPHPWD